MARNDVTSALELRVKGKRFGKTRNFFYVILSLELSQYFKRAYSLKAYTLFFFFSK